MSHKPPPRRPDRPGPQGSAPKPASRRQPPAGRHLPTAILTGLALAGLVAGLLYLGAAPFYGFVCVVVLLAQGEFYRACRGAGYNPAAALGLGAGAVLLIGVFARGEAAAPVVLIATLAGSFLWFMVGDRQDGLVTNVAVTVLGLVYIPLLGTFVGLLALRPDGRALTVMAIGAAAVYDIFAYAGGSKLGKHKLAKAISPNKSWEGAAVATAATVGLAILAGPALGPFNIVQAAIVGAAISIVAPLGDLFESMVKRDLDLKDMGTILPGHGGALDRIDAMLFVVPTVYFLLEVFGL